MCEREAERERQIQRHEYLIYYYTVSNLLQNRDRGRQARTTPATHAQHTRSKYSPPFNKKT